MDFVMMQTQKELWTTVPKSWTNARETTVWHPTLLAALVAFLVPVVA